MPDPKGEDSGWISFLVDAAVSDPAEDGRRWIRMSRQEAVSVYKAVGGMLLAEEINARPD